VAGECTGIFFPLSFAFPAADCGGVSRTRWQAWLIIWNVQFGCDPSRQFQRLVEAALAQAARDAAASPRCNRGAPRHAASACPQGCLQASAVRQLSEACTQLVERKSVGECRHSAVEMRRAFQAAANIAPLRVGRRTPGNARQTNRAGRHRKPRTMRHGGWLHRTAHRVGRESLPQILRDVHKVLRQN